MQVIEHYIYEGVTGIYDLYKCLDHEDKFRYFKRCSDGKLHEIYQEDFIHTFVNNALF